MHEIFCHFSVKKLNMILAIAVEPPFSQNKRRDIHDKHKAIKMRINKRKTVRA